MKFYARLFFVFFFALVGQKFLITYNGNLYEAVLLRMNEKAVKLEIAGEGVWMESERFRESIVRKLKDGERML